VWEAHYGVTGKVDHVETCLIDQPVRLQGQYHDAESGLSYNRHRYFDPDTGYFISHDPIGLNGGINPYQFAPNLFGWADPYGLSTVYLRDNEVYVGKAKQNAKTRYKNGSVATDILTGIPNTDVAQGVEQIVYERMKESDLAHLMTNVRRPVNMDNKKKVWRRQRGEEWLMAEFGVNYQDVIDERVASHYKGRKCANAVKTR
jgi:RHS repeat-associated protein